MSTAIHGIATGSFVSAGTAVNISIPCGYTEIELTNITDLGSTASNTNVMKAWGTSLMPAGYGIYGPKTSGAATIALSVTTATNGFTFLADSGAMTVGPAQTITTGVSQATQAVVTTTNTTNFVNGSIVRLYGTTGMLQIAGMPFTIGSVSAGVSFTLPNMDTSGFSAPATGGTAVLLNPQGRFTPSYRYITKVTSSGTSSIITMSVTHNYAVGQAVRLIVPSQFGMIQLNNLIGNITAINASDGVSTNTITVDIDSSAFTAFAFPTSATAALGVSFALVVPVGEDANGLYANLLDDATRNQSITGVIVGTSMQTSGKTYQWVARKGQAI